MIIHNDISNDSRIWREARSLHSQGRNVVAVCIVLGSSQLPAVEETEAFTIIRISPRIFRHPNVRTVGKLVQLILALPMVIFRLRQVNASIYHAHDFIGLVLVAFAGIWKRPVVYDSHELFFDRTFNGIPRWVIKLLMLMRPLEKLLAKRAVAWIATSDKHADCLAEDLDIPRPVVVRNVVDLRFQGYPERTFPDGDYQQIVHSGKLLDGRHLFELIEALTYLPAHVVLVLLGDGPLRQPLITHAEKLKVKERLFILAPVRPDNVAATLAQATLATSLITSSEGLSYLYCLPNKLLEAVAAKLPIVASPNPELKKIVEEYDMGLCCDPADPRDIADKVAHILQPANLELFQAGAGRAQAELRWENEEQKLIDVYKPIIASKVNDRLSEGGVSKLE